MITMSRSQVREDQDDDHDVNEPCVAAARRQFLLGTVLAKQKQELVTLITATLTLDLNLPCTLLDYTLACSTTGKYTLNAKQIIYKEGVIKSWEF